MFEILVCLVGPVVVYYLARMTHRLDRILKELESLGSELNGLAAEVSSIAADVDSIAPPGKDDYLPGDELTNPKA